MVNHVAVAVGIAVALVFGTGVVLGVIVAVAVAVRREDRRYTLAGPPPDAVARGVRRLVGVGRRDLIPPDDGPEPR